MIKYYFRYIRQMVQQMGVTRTDAARRFCIAHPDVALCIMEEIGNWPSSEPELAALQRVWK
jgi:hypothetical protein